jgi:hypothetical protein
LGDANFRLWIKGFSDSLRQLQNTNVMCGAHIKRHKRWSSKQYCPEPYGEVGSIQIRSSRGSIAPNLNRPAAKNIVDEVTDGEVQIEGKMGAAESPAPRDFAIEGSGLLLKKRTKQFRGPFSFRVDVSGIQ